MSQPEQIIFFREHLFELPLKYYKTLGNPTRYAEALLQVISRARDEDVSPEKYLKYAKRALKGIKGREEVLRDLEVSKVYQKYQALKAEKGLIDFGDQVSLALKLFRQSSKLLKEYQQRYKYILVDEFQDTNYAQFELLKLLAGKSANLTVVGDDDQSIYKFRGAAISNILSFEKVYKKCKKVVLTKNYRSSQAILDAARRLIKHNDPERLEVIASVDKKLVAVLPNGPLPVHKHFDRVTSEADWVAQVIKEKNVPFKDIAILVRSNADAEPFRQSLNLLGIPHQFSGGGGLYAFPEVKLASSFLRVIGDPADSVSLYDLALSEIYRLDPLDLQKINTFASRRNLTLHHVFAHLPEFDILADIKPDSRKKIEQIMADIHYYLGFAKHKSTGELLYHFLNRSGFLGALTKTGSLQDENRLQNLARFFERVREFKEVAAVDRVAEFVKHLNVLKEAGEDPESARPDLDIEAVNILTVHKAKGLEWPLVFMVALVDEKFPVRRRKQSIELPSELIKETTPKGDYHLMEERRLFYVAMTRAKNELYLTSAIDYGGKRDRKVSPFVLEALDLPKADISIIKRPAIDQIKLFEAAEPLLPAKRKRTADEIIQLSHYQIDDYLTCPLKYKYVHILHIPLLPNHQIVYGSALHKAVQAYFSAKKQGKKLTEKQLLEIFQNNWSSEGFISRQHEEQRYKNGQVALKRFFKADKKRCRIPQYVEEEFTVLQDKIQVRGRWDLVETEKDKAYIVDFKSSDVRQQTDADRRARESLQLAIYTLAWHKMFNSLPDGLQLYFLETGLVGTTQKKEADLKKTWEKIKRVADGIRSANFTAIPSYIVCGYCPYREICPSSVA
jgi:DNA helicase-2/ATP-dependent DNA helicase PcrA